MALGKQIGEFSFKATSITASSGPGKATTLQANFEGPQSGEAGTGAALVTLTAVAEPGAKSGTWSWSGMGFMDNGDTMSITGKAYKELPEKSKTKSRIEREFFFTGFLAG